MSDFPLGQPIRLGFLTYSDPANTTLADPSTVEFTIHTPTGAVETFTWAAAEIVRSSVGDFYLTYVPTVAGHYELLQEAHGLVETARTDAFTVLASFAQVISVSDIRTEALNKTLPNDDREIQRMLTAALAEYEEWVGPVSGTVTETFDGGGTTLVLRQPVSAITAAAYDSGVTLTYTDLTVENGIVRWGYGTAGRFLPGRVSITYTAGALPANHRETIIADVAGYFEATQRGGTGRPAFAGESDGGYVEGYIGHPQELFPLIRALANQYPAIA